MKKCNIDFIGGDIYAFSNAIICGPVIASLEI